MFSDSTLSLFLIDKSRLRLAKYLLLYGAVLAFMLIFSFLKGHKVGKTGDFNVFWTAGVNFTSGVDLYSYIGGAERYIYPPFAAMLFQFFGLFSLHTAATIFTFINFLLFLVSIALTREIFTYFDIPKKAMNYALLFGVICSFRFFWYHTLFVQMNELMFVLCLLGVLASLKDREWLAVACIIAATFIKVLPVFFIPWLLLRGNYKTVFKMIICAAVCILLPLIWRGWQTGMLDLQHYYSTFLEPFKEGRVEPEFHNQSLAATIYRLCLPYPLGGDFNYQIVNFSAVQAARIYKISFLLLSTSLIGFLGWEKFINKKNTLRGIALIFICMHLLSGITWEYHLVSLLFVYAVFALYYKTEMGFIQKLIFYTLSLFIILFSIVGKDTVGDYLYHYLEGYGVVALTMLGMYIFMIGNKFILIPNSKIPL